MTLEQQVHDLELRVRKLEKLSHVPVTFIEDENGFLRLAKPTTRSKDGTGNNNEPGGE